MNKSLLGFRQRHVPNSPTDPVKSELDPDGALASRRLSPIGESFSSTPPETESDDKVLPSTNGTKEGINRCVNKDNEQPLIYNSFPGFSETCVTRTTHGSSWQTEW